jgi:hypothetical protein
MWIFMFLVQIAVIIFTVATDSYFIVLMFEMQYRLLTVANCLY